MRLQLLVTACVVIAACTRHQGTVAPDVTILYEAVGTSPATGATNVEPNQVVTISFSRPATSLRDGAFSVHDGGAALPGTFTLRTDGMGVRFDPDRPLPRGNELRIQQNSTQGPITLATFTVRETNAARIYELPGATVSHVYAWPGGRRAVRTNDQRLFEVSQLEMVERFVWASGGARLFGDEKFGYSEFDSTLGYFVWVRASLDGPEERIATPAGVSIRDVNDRGDCCVYVAPGVGNPSQQGVWLLRAEWFAWRWLGPLPQIGLVTPQLKLDADGNVFAMRVEDEVLTVDYFDVNSNVPRSFTRTFPNSNQWVHDYTGPREGVVAWMGLRDEVWRELRIARFTADGGFDDLGAFGAWNIFSPVPLGPSATASRVEQSAGGSTLVFTNYSGGAGSSLGYDAFVRLQPDGTATQPETFRIVPTMADSPWVTTSVSPQRGELWVVSDNDKRRLTLRRSRPGSKFEEERLIYNVSNPAYTIGYYTFDFDDSGRSVFAVNERSGSTVVGARIIVLD